MKMRILYDGAIYQWQSAGGINRYFANLISRLPNDFEPVLTTCRRQGFTYPTHPRLRVLGFKRFRPQSVSLKLERAYLGRVAALRNFNLVHPTYYTLLSQADIGTSPCPVVLTVWDMIHELFPEHFGDGAELARCKRRAIERADAVICISENTKRDLLERYRIPEGKVVVTHLASELDESHAHGDERVPAFPYFLYVGSRAGYKNFDGLLSAFARVATAHAELTLCVVGELFSEAEQRNLAELKLGERVEHFGRVSDSHLAKLYRRSLAFVYPSLYEGFGIPPLEAMACGTAVVASNRSSLPEVVGDAGLLFDPEKADELTDILLRLAGSETEREGLVLKGRKRARLFSWEQTVGRTLDVYRSVAG